MPAMHLSDVVRSVEYHHFFIRNRWLLFDVNGLRVEQSEELDGRLLKAARAGISSTALCAFAEAIAGDGKGMARIEVLRSSGFLCAAPQLVPLAELGKPTNYSTFMINVSQRCNLTCPYCYVNKGHFDYELKPVPKMRSETSSSIVQRIHEIFPKMDTYGYHFYGGEPLLNFRAIREIVEEANTKAKSNRTKADFHITTNGTLLTREIADFMDANKFTVYFSIDGNQASHDEYRKYLDGSGSFEDVERNLEYLRSCKGVHLIGSSVIRNGFTLTQALSQLNQHGAVQSKAERVRLRDTNVLSLADENHSEYIKDIERLADHYIHHLEQVEKPMDFRLSPKILQVFLRKRREFFCPAGSRMYGISANGEIYPCALHVGRPQSMLGNLEHGIDEEKRRTFRAQFSANHQTDCQKCWTRHLCGGGCSAMVDRFGHEDCESLRKESEAAIGIYQHFVERDPLKLLGLISPKIVKWTAGKLRSAESLKPTEPAAERIFESVFGAAEDDVDHAG